MWLISKITHLDLSLLRPCFYLLFFTARSGYTNESNRTWFTVFSCTVHAEKRHKSDTHLNTSLTISCSISCSVHYKLCRISANAVVLTSGRLAAVESMSKVLRVLDDGNTTHADYDGVRSRVERAGCDDTMVDMMKRACRVFLAADNCHWACRVSTK